LRRDEDISRAGDDGHLLADAMLAALKQPGKQQGSPSKWFDLINARLGETLKASFRDDVITGVAELHAMFAGEDH
jgi:hypothetical protein